MDETLFLYGYIVFVIGIVIILIIMNTKKMLRGRSTVSIPPGSEGLPLIGETLQFMAAINSSQGFYQFIQVRHLKYVYFICSCMHRFINTTCTCTYLFINQCLDVTSTE